MSVKNVYLKKKIEGTIYDIYPHTDAGIVEFTPPAVNGGNSITTTVYEELTALRTLIADTEARILGLTDEHANDTIIATYDTIREIASYLSTNGDAIATINSLNNTVGDASSGLVKDVADNASNISTLETTVGDAIVTINSLNNTVGDAIATINSLNNTVGDASSGLVRDVADNASNISALETTVGDAIVTINSLNNTVDDASSGLVKRVNDLETTVGSASSGLVRDVADNASDISTLETTVGDASSGLVKRVTDLETATSSAGSVYVVNSITADSASDNALYIVLDKEEIIDQP